MRRTTRLAIWVFACALALQFSGCINSGSEEVQITLEEDLSGHITFILKDISSSQDSPAQQQEELKNFYDDLPQIAEDLKEHGLKDATIELTNQTALSCDAILKARFDHILNILPLLGEGGQRDYEIVKQGELFSLRFWPNGLTTDALDRFSLEYRGKVIAHDSQSGDPEAPILQWEIKNSGISSIYFCLGRRQEN